MATKKSVKKKVKKKAVSTPEIPEHRKNDLGPVATFVLLILAIIILGMVFGAIKILFGL